MAVKPKPAPPAGHDHRGCMEATLARALALAEAGDLRLTPLRRTVLELVAESHHPLGAYDILEKLAARRAEIGARVAPPTVYRALEFLQRAGLVHRIDSLNAFIACFAPGQGHQSVFLICEACGVATEASDDEVSAALARVAAARGFTPRRETVEILGRCAACAAA